MEFIFECFYEDTLDKLCRNGLQDRSSRRDVLDHLNAIIGGCSDGKYFVYFTILNRISNFLATPFLINIYKFY